MEKTLSRFTAAAFGCSLYAPDRYPCESYTGYRPLEEPSLFLMVPSRESIGLYLYVMTSTSFSTTLLEEATYSTVS